MAPQKWKLETVHHRRGRSQEWSSQFCGGLSMCFFFYTFVDSVFSYASVTVLKKVARFRLQRSEYTSTVAKNAAEKILKKSNSGTGTSSEDWTWSSPEGGVRKDPGPAGLMDCRGLSDRD